ncbi:MAG: tyrosine-protein phosphatase [Kiritimatiellae bacterium]|nr:tyrosine-protein phosphatase [Kiritimatiellia bacterium]
MLHKSRLAVAASLLTLAASAAIEPFSPANGATVALLTEPQKKIMAIPTYAERLATLKADHDKPHDDRYYGKDRESKWRISNPLVLRWRTTAGEKGPWKIVLGMKPDLSDAASYWVEAGHVKSRQEKDAVRFKWTVPRPNLKLGQTYYWKVWSDIKCKDYSCGSTINGPCKCGKAKGAHESPVASFTTDAQPPRWIAIEGRVGNIRDLGGWTTSAGRRVKQGMVFRGQGLNDNSVNGDAKGRNRLMVEDIDFFINTLGVKTDLDLRSDREVADMKQSPLGAGVTFIHHPSSAYAGIFKKNPDDLSSNGMKTMAENFRVFCDEKNYPIYFHCIGGADRTGSLAYVLNGILGVDRHDLETDWESTFYPALPELRKDYTGPTFWCGENHFNDGFAKYGDANATWNERIELYLLDCGVTKEEIAKFRSIMLE